MTSPQKISAMTRNTFKIFSKKLNVPVEKIAPVESVENILVENSLQMAMAAKSNLAKHVKSSEMINSIKVFKGKANYYILIGPDYSYYKSFVLRFIEYGTVRVNTPNNKGGVRVTIDRTPFMRPAFEAYKGKVFEGIKKDITKLIISNTNKLIKQ